MNASALSNLTISDPSGALEALDMLVSLLEQKGAMGARPGHHRRVLSMSLTIGGHLGLSEDDLARLSIAARFHDLGCVALPDQLMAQARRLNPAEYELVKLHPRHGSDILRPLLRDTSVLEAILYHHEHFGGGGYPTGRRGEEIPQLARVLAVPEVFDAMVDERPWRGALSISRARALVREQGGSLFDPRVAEAFLAIPEQDLSAWLSVDSRPLAGTAETSPSRD